MSLSCRTLTGVVLLVGALATSACQVSLATDVTVAGDGSGRIALLVGLDKDLASSLATDDVDVFAGLEALPDGWTTSRRDGGRAVTVAADFTDPAGLTRRVAQLRAGLDEQDPTVLDDVTLDVADDGSATFAGMAGFLAPSSTGLKGAGVAFDGQDLARLLADRGDEVLRVDLRVAMPGPVVGGNADMVDGNVATWRLPVTELACVQARSDPPSAVRRWVVTGAQVLVGLAFGFVLVSVLRRRRAGNLRRPR